MMGSFLSRALMLTFGYAYPAYECFKTVDKNKPEIEQLVLWCQYWVLIALLTICERVSDAFISWLPLYGEAKLALFIYLRYPKTKGTTYIYNSFLRPYLAKHETEIDRNLLELRVKAREIAVVYWQKAVCHGQTMFFKILQYVSLTQPQPAQVSYPWIRRNSPHALGCHGVVGVHFSCSVFPSWSLEKQNRKQQQHARDGQPLASFLPHHESSFEESAAEASSKPISSKLEAENANANANSPQKVSVIEGAVRSSRMKG
ncbi:putative HVA22-like protein g [Vitis vinifera]|uniref:HVA22-like protein n=1 Tax=Vitis vinifera TaxID=29760 RepID=A0A438I9D5_VITVI|nr:putative HVA22-like protein g [Vitis vinifera]